MIYKRWYKSQTFLLALAVGASAACFVFIAAKPPAEVDVLVLTKDKNANEKLIESDLRSIGVSANELLDGAISDYSKIEGKRLKYPRLAGDQIVARNLFKPNIESKNETDLKGEFVYAGIKVENYNAIADYLDPGTIINIQYVQIGQAPEMNGNPGIIENARVIGVSKTNNSLTSGQDRSIAVMMTKQDGLRLGEYALSGRMFITINADNK